MLTKLPSSAAGSNPSIHSVVTGGYSARPAPPLIMREPRFHLKGSNRQHLATSRLQGVLTPGPRVHAGPGGQVGHGRSVDARVCLSRYSGQRARGFLAGIGGARRADRALHVSGSAPLHEGASPRRTCPTATRTGS